MSQKAVIVALIFDFDDTLGSDTTSGFLRTIGVDVESFWAKRVAARIRDQHWDPVPAYLHEMIQVSQEGTTITKDALQEWGARAPLFAGVPEAFQRVREYAKSLDESLVLEYYVVSSGIGDVIRSSPIASEFKDIFASEFAYDEEGRIVFPKRIVSFTDKTRYLFQISKGLVGDKGREFPFAVNRRVDEEDLRVPFPRMVFVGDGYTDVPCFSLMRKLGGYALAVFHPEEKSRWSHSWAFIDEQRVHNLVRADYRPDSSLFGLLQMAVRAIYERHSLESRFEPS